MVQASHRPSSEALAGVHSPSTTTETETTAHLALTDGKLAIEGPSLGRHHLPCALVQRCTMLRDLLETHSAQHGSSTSVALAGTEAGEAAWRCWLAAQGLGAKSAQDACSTMPDLSRLSCESLVQVRILLMLRFKCGHCLSSLNLALYTQYLCARSCDAVAAPFQCGQSNAFGAHSISPACTIAG